MIFNFKNSNPLQELNAYKKGMHMNLKQYNKALLYLTNGYTYQLIVDSSKEPIKVLKVLKGNKF